MTGIDVHRPLKTFTGPRIRKRSPRSTPKYKCKDITRLQLGEDFHQIFEVDLLSSVRTGLSSLSRGGNTPVTPSDTNFTDMVKGNTKDTKTLVSGISRNIKRSKPVSSQDTSNFPLDQFYSVQRGKLFTEVIEPK